MDQILELKDVVVDPVINISPRRRLGGRKTDLSLEMNGTTLESGDRCHRKHEMLMFSIFRSQRVLALGADPVD